MLRKTLSQNANMHRDRMGRGAKLILFNTVINQSFVIMIDLSRVYIKNKRACGVGGWAPLWWASMWSRHRREREVGQFVHWEERWNWRLDSGENQADVSVQACAACEGHVWVCGPTANRICVAAHGSCYHQRPCRSLWARLPPEAMLLSKSHSSPGAILTWDIHGPPPRALSGPMVLLQPGSVLLPGNM